MLASQPTRFRLILSYITPHRRVLLAVLGLLVAGSLLALTNPWMAGLLTRRTIDFPDSEMRTLSAYSQLIPMESTIRADRISR